MAQFEKLIFPKSYTYNSLYRVEDNLSIDSRNYAYQFLGIVGSKYTGSGQNRKEKKQLTNIYEEQDVFPTAVAAYTVEKIQILYTIYTEQHHISSVASTTTNHSSDNGVK